MAELLQARGPFADGGLPLAHGAARLAEFAPGAILSIMPFRGREEAVGSALGLDLPADGSSATGPAGRLVWAGRRAWLLFAEVAPEGLAERLSGLAAVTDLSDGYAGLSLSGENARAVLARLCPLDLAGESFADGAAARSLIGHIGVHLIRNGEAFEILALRSYASSLLHDVTTAMRSVAAQRQMAAG
ncbi:MAG: sarcosine oxidase subunit gamma [Alphaproteobacteria bacterium]|nr:MAG: sarcosine oxidase subunit gamma [Alphaproteobacteria bacterium]